ncbi:uncharacterized protein L203_105302 [Cryptococcus depauperatus CBS 7841]|uniref:ATP-dependent DNA helicase n=1 Tax=Cryptococcus depauperatus CBS 7841 TaxID=1295531 RepID=A0AAJ8JX34_9TREE
MNKSTFHFDIGFLGLNAFSVKAPFTLYPPASATPQKVYGILLSIPRARLGFMRCQNVKVSSTRLDCSSEQRLSEPIVISDESDQEEATQEFYGEKPFSSVTREKRKGRIDVAGRVQSTVVENCSLEDREAIKTKLSKLDAEIDDVKAQLEPLQSLLASLKAERQVLQKEVSHLCHVKPDMLPSSAHVRLDYQSSSFPFSDAVLQTLKNVFSLSSFRMCQQGVINAAVDNRDIICVMPTGGGKSLTYQLPAVIGSGLTVVISPLLALIWDQVRGLRELGIECTMITGSIGRDEQNDIYRRLKEGTKNRAKEIQLCYVTPEKMSRSKRFISILEKLNSEARLNEAHCCSQLGHDFRPDYKKLSMLKALFPRVPIQAVTATLSSKSLPDLLKILQMNPITDGRDANATGTVFFSAPLFRPNLHYKVFSKPPNAKATIAAMGQWIKDQHNGESGIIYCLSKRDATNVADELFQWSEGNIKTGVYHAEVSDDQKEALHIEWRKGKINCICATIAFGMGIDKGDVRYVIHHSMSKTLEGYYQETGRAGRDGKTSDCVLFYRGQDCTRLASLVFADVDGLTKLKEMLRFAQDLTTCRKVAFAKYFHASSSLSASAWDQPPTSSSPSASSHSNTICKICDNCLRQPHTIITRDVTFDSWKILRIAQTITANGGRVTLQSFCNLVRGLGNGNFTIGDGKDKNQGTINLDDVEGKVDLNIDDVEILTIHLFLLGYLNISFHATPYSVNAYMISSNTAVRLTRFSRAAIEAGEVMHPITCTFPQNLKKDKLHQAFKKEKVAKVSTKGENRSKRKTNIEAADVQMSPQQAKKKMKATRDLDVADA